MIKLKHYSCLLSTLRSPQYIRIYIKFIKIIETTPGHLFRLSQGAWRPASELNVGDTVITSNGTEATVESTEEIEYDEDIDIYNLNVADFHTYFVADTGVLVHNDCTIVETIVKANPQKVINALKDFISVKWNFGNQNFLLDKKGMKHILERHHPEYWNGTIKNTQTFLDKSMTIEDISNYIGDIMKQNRNILIEKGTVGMYQIEGTINNVTYVVGFKNGRIGQFYKK
ncbi:HINT domain-containing protein [Clostridium bornimense]|nr:HINT domain-containing protein [Clostridium bornimense]